MFGLVEGKKYTLRNRRGQTITSGSFVDYSMDFQYLIAKIDNYGYFAMFDTYMDAVAEIFVKSGDYLTTED
jgi:hypothetical protein